MNFKCPNCGAAWIQGIFPGSEGWCKAECDLLEEVTLHNTFLAEAIAYATTLLSNAIDDPD